MSSERPRSRLPRSVRRRPPQTIPIEPEPRRRFSIRTARLPAVLVAAFALAIAIGTALLMLPWSTQEREWTHPATALFVSTSAVCVTGLTPVDTGTYWSGFGHAVILALVQVGGFGFMTTATLLFLIFGWRVGLRERVLLSQSLDLGRLGGVVGLARRAVIFTLAAEVVGAALLTARFAFDEPLHTAVWHGVFHSVSAFNNAGFDLLGGGVSLQAHDDAFIVVPIGLLIFLGGIGYLVVEDIRSRRPGVGLSVDSRLILKATAGLLLFGFLMIALLEWNTTLEGRRAPDKLLQSAFHSVTPRSGGLTTLPVGEMNDETQFLNIGLMFIGGASGSTAGGIKVGAFAILVALVVSTIRGRERPEAEGREISGTDVNRALAVTLLTALLVFLVSIALARLEGIEFLDVLFEVVSAFGTVGLSTGVTPQLTNPGLVVVSLMMFVGRLGPLTLVIALAQRAQSDQRRLAEDRVRVG